MILLESDRYYHIYNHANGSDDIFTCEENYMFFLKKYEEHIGPIANTYAYCLMPNHFHLLVKIKDEKEIGTVVINTTHNLTGFQNLSGYEKFISKQFSNLFNSYTKALNKQTQRMGNLFQRPFKRKIIDTEQYLKQLIIYIHTNPVHHGFTANAASWKYSSYNIIIGDEKTNLKRNEVISLFDDRKNFKAVHRIMIDMISEISFE
jgi:putative transposase